VLEAAGLGAVEESTYLDLVRRGPATVTELAGRAGLTLPRARRAVTGLHRKGLVHRTPPPQDLVVPVPPDLAVDHLIQRRREELERVRETAQRLAAESHDRAMSRRADRLIEIVPVASGVLHAFDQVQRTAKHEVRVLVAPRTPARRGSTRPSSTGARPASSTGRCTATRRWRSPASWPRSRPTCARASRRG